MANVVLLHGMWSNPETARPLRDFLEEAGHCVFSPALPGHDPSRPMRQKDVAELSLTDYVRSIEEYLDSMEFSEPPVLVGHSMGGLLAQLLADRRDIAGVCLMNSAAPRGINHLFPRPAWFFRRTLLRPFFWRKSQQPTLAEVEADLFGEIDRDRAKEVHATLGPESGRALFELVFWWIDRGRTSEVGDLSSVPMFIVSGGKDRVVHPGVADALSVRYPHAEFQRFPETGHWIFHEPGEEEIYDAVEIWISATFGKPGSFLSYARHHAVPRLLRSEDLPSFGTPVLRCLLGDARGLRRSADEDAETDGGTVLPR